MHHSLTADLWQILGGYSGQSVSVKNVPVTFRFSKLSVIMYTMCIIQLVKCLWTVRTESFSICSIQIELLTISYNGWTFIGYPTQSIYRYLFSLATSMEETEKKITAMAQHMTESHKLSDCQSWPHPSDWTPHSSDRTGSKDGEAYHSYQVRYLYGWKTALNWWHPLQSPTPEKQTMTYTTCTMWHYTCSTCHQLDISSEMKTGYHNNPRW